MSYTLLTLSDITVLTQTTSDTGTLSLECITEQPEGDGDTEGRSDEAMALALRLNAFNFVLDRNQHASLVIAPSGRRVYTFHVSTDGSNAPSNEKDEKRPTVLRVEIPPPSANGSQVAEDIETFDHLLMQYSDLSWVYGDPDTIPTIPPPLPARPATPASAVHHANIGANINEAKPVDDPSLRGRLVLMDESNGEVVGELPQTMNITEDSALTGKPAGPVVLEMHPDMYDACTGTKELNALGEDLLETRQVFARAVPPEEQDWIMKSATLVSQTISVSTSLLLSGITAASNFYISHTSPGTSKNPTPTHSRASSPASQGLSPQLPHPIPTSAPTSPSASSTALAKAYELSGQARVASAKTVDAVEGVIRRAVGAKPNPNSRYTPPPLTPSGPTEVSRAPPPAYAVYTPKHRSSSSRSSSRRDVPATSAEKKVEEEKEEEDEQAEKRPLGTKDKLLLSANLVITTIDDSARRMFDVTTDRLGAVVGHKFGSEAQRSTHFATHTARNIMLVYVDVRGFARRALITKTGKEFAKARFGGKDKDKDMPTPRTNTPAPGSRSSTPARPSSTGPVPSSTVHDKA